MTMLTQTQALKIIAFMARWLIALITLSCANSALFALGSIKSFPPSFEDMGNYGFVFLFLCFFINWVIIPTGFVALALLWATNHLSKKGALWVGGGIGAAFSCLVVLSRGGDVWGLDVVLFLSGAMLYFVGNAWLFWKFWQLYLGNKRWWRS